MLGAICDKIIWRYNNDICTSKIKGREKNRLKFIEQKNEQISREKIHDDSLKWKAWGISRLWWKYEVDVGAKKIVCPIGNYLQEIIGEWEKMEAYSGLWN